MEWIDLARDRGRWRSVINAVIIFGLHNSRDFRLVEEM